jgi:HlyD family secretion protein
MPIEVSQNGTLHQASPPQEGIKGEAVQEFISRKPGFLIQYGTTLFLILLILIVLASWFIQYPDVVLASAKLQSINAPKPVVNKTAGKLIKLFAKEGDAVKENQVLGYMESIASPEQVLTLSSAIDSINELVNKHLELLPAYIKNLNLESLGELQQPYQTFIEAFIVYKDYIGNGFYARKKAMLATDLKNLEKLHSNLNNQKTIQQEDETLALKTFKMNETLLKEKVISEKEFRDERSKLLNKSLSVPQVNSAIISNENEQNDKQKEILELENTALQQQAVFMQALNTFKSEIDDWKKKYLLIAPVAGTVSFQDFLQEKQELNINQIICYIKPVNSAYYAEVYIPQSNFGKIKINQSVLLKFQAYPYEQYGSVVGKLEFISPIPTDSGYAAKIKLPNGLVTNYGKQIAYRDGLISSAQIITQNMRLLQRFYYDIYKQVKRE